MECLPVFKNQAYTESLNKLVNSRDLQTSFDLKQNQEFKDLWNALNAFTDGKFFMKMLGKALKKKIIASKFAQSSGTFITSVQ